MQKQFEDVKSFGGNAYGNRRSSTGSSSSQQSNASSYTIRHQNQREVFYSKGQTRSSEKPGLEKQANRKCIVYLLDGHPIEFAYKNSLTVQELYDIVCTQLLLQEKEYFGLFTYDELRHKQWLDMKAKVTSCVLDTSKPHFEIYLGVKFFVLSVKRLRHFTTIELFYLQCRKLIFGDELKAHRETQFELAATALQESYGDFESHTVTEEYLRKTPLLSGDAWLSEESSLICERKVAEYHMRLVGKTRGEAILHYMSIVESLPMYGMHFYCVNGKAAYNPLWVSIGLMGLQEWISKGWENESQEERDIAMNDIHIRTSISKFDWSSISHIRHEKKELTIEVEQKYIDGCVGDDGHDSSVVPRTPRALTIEDDSRRLFNMRTPLLGRGSSGNWSSRKNKTGVFSWSGKSEVTKTMFKLACEHHKFYLQHILATDEELHSGLTSPYQQNQWSPFLGPYNARRLTGVGGHNAIANGAEALKKGVPGPLRSLQDVSATELSNSELSINSSSGFSDSGLPAGVSTGAPYMSIQNNSHASSQRKESQSESCGGTASCSTSQSLSMLSGTSDLGPSLETLQDLVAAFSAQRDSLLDKLRKKLEQLKEVCLQESEITGKLPVEYPLSPGASPPPPRRRVGTAFQLSENVLLNMNQSLKRSNKNSREAQDIKNLEEERLGLQIDVDIETQIIEAEKKLLSENKKSKRGKRKVKWQNIQKREAQLRGMQLELAQLNRDIEKQKIQAYNSSMRESELKDNELFSVFSSPPQDNDNDESGERSRAKSVSERYKHHVASTDALNAPSENDLQEVVKEVLSYRTESIVKSSPNSPVLNRNSRIYNSAPWNSSSRNTDGSFFPEEHENTSLSSSQFDKRRTASRQQAIITPYSPERRFTSDFSPSVYGGRQSGTEVERNLWKFSEEEEVAGYVPSGVYQVTDYRTTTYPTYSVKKLRHKSEEDLLGSPSSNNNWRQPVKSYQKTSTASLNAQPNSDRRESQLRSMTQMLNASSLGAAANYSAFGASNTSCASSNISSNKEEHMSSRSSYSSLNKRYVLSYSSAENQSHNTSNLPTQTTWQPERSRTSAPQASMGLTQSQSLQAFYGTVSPMKSTFDSADNYECDEVSVSSAEVRRSSPQSAASYDASSYYQRCVSNRKSQQLDASVAYYF